MDSHFLAQHLATAGGWGGTTVILSPVQYSKWTAEWDDAKYLKTLPLMATESELTSTPDLDDIVGDFCMKQSQENNALR